MKRTIYIISLILAFSCILTLMVGCNQGKKDEITYGDYSVKIVDGLGNPMSQVVVKFSYPDGETTKTRITEADGTATLKNVPDGTYNVTLEKGFSTAQFDVSQFVLNKEEKSLEIIVRDETKTVDIYGNIGDGFAYGVGVGSYSIPTVDNYSLYLVFTPPTRGVYRFTLNSADADATIGYYGIPLFVQLTHCDDGEYDGRTFEIIIQDPNTPYVIGIKTTKRAETSFAIERKGDAPFDPEYAPWNYIEKTADIGKCDIPDETKLIDFDITDPSLTVVERDGVYYTADGKPVYVRITSGNSSYLGGASLALLAGFVDDKIGMNIGGYIYDDNGDFVEKRNYNMLIEDYMELCDGGYGVVPLTSELAECIKIHSESNQWCDSTSPNYIFGDVNEISENAWLFLCMIEQ